MSEPLQISCPCCAARLSVDPDTGAVLHHEAPKITEKVSLEDALRGEKARQEEAAERFRQAFDQTSKREDILQKKFREAQKRAEKEPGKPRSPFDLD
jgi:hypothetical protein